MQASTLPMASLLTDVQLVDMQPGAYVFGAWHSVNVVVWMRSATIEIIQRFEQGVLDRARQHPMLSSIHIITVEAGPPEPQAREALIAVNERLAHTVACGAVVIERGGVTGIALRSAITGMIILAPRQYRIKVFDTLEPCAPWVVAQHSKRAGIEVDPGMLLQVLRNVRAAAE